MNICVYICIFYTGREREDMQTNTSSREQVNEEMDSDIRRLPLSVYYVYMITHGHSTMIYIYTHNIMYIIYL